jgi:2-oxoglutarate ferredoxin oxidoreductase subunit beta
MGSIDNPLNILSVAIGCEATFVARSVDVNTKHLGMCLERAAEHRGTSFIEVYQNCVVFNDGAFEYATDRNIRSDALLELEHGKPMVFGKEGNKGIRLSGMDPEVVTLGDGATEADLLVHDEAAKEPSLAYFLTRMHYPAFPEPIGVFRCVDRPKYDEMLNAQVNQAVEKQGPGSLQKLFTSGDTWTVA